MEQHDVGAPSGGVEERVNLPVNERARRLGPGWDLQPRDLAWISNYRDWGDVRADLLNLAKKPLNLFKRWL